MDSQGRPWSEVVASLPLAERLAAASADTDPIVMTALAHDPDVTVRLALALNPSLNDRARSVLAHDPDPEVRRRIQRRSTRPVRHPRGRSWGHSRDLP